MTVEAAIAVAALVAVLAVLLGAGGAVVLRIRCVDAAAEVARLASRDDAAGARDAGARLLPAGGEVTVEPAGDDVRVRVVAPVLGGALPVLRVSADAVAAREPDTTGPVAGTVPDGTAADAAAPPDGTATGAAPPPEGTATDPAGVPAVPADGDGSP